MQKKNVFLSGKVREFDEKNQQAFCQDIMDYVKNTIGIDVPVTVAVDDAANSIEVTYHASINVHQEPGMIHDSQTLIFSGESVTFKPKYELGATLPHFPGYNYWFDIKDYIDVHKKNSREYHASRVKDIKIDLQPDRMKIKFMF